MPDAVSIRWIYAAALGAVCIASSATLIRLSGTSPGTAAVFRCLYALPLLGVLAFVERRRHGPAERREFAGWLLAGLFFALDLVGWHISIGAVGAGIATVLVNLQVVFVGLAGWLLGESSGRRRALITLLPVFVGLILISGVSETGSYGSEPVPGTLFGIAAAVAYAGFLLTMRHTTIKKGRMVSSLFVATAAATASSAVMGLIAGGIDPVPTWPAHGWLILVAVLSQVIGWLLITPSLPRLGVSLTALVLMIQPAAALVIAAVVVGEHLSAVQLLGALVLLAAIAYAAHTAKAGALSKTGILRWKGRGSAAESAAVETVRMPTGVGGFRQPTPQKGLEID